MSEKATIDSIFAKSSFALDVKTDQILSSLLMIEWVVSILFCILFSPRTWYGDYSQIHIHLYAALFVGGPAALFPVFLVNTQAGAKLNRYVIAISQMVFSTLLIHATAGRLETHFHIFGSLAFLAFYREWQVLIVATLITGADHFIEGMYWPQAIYGTSSSTNWRALEHVAWVLFEDVILFLSIRNSVSQLKTNAEQLFKLEEAVQIANHANAMKSIFLANISHELRTPMHGILGFADLGKEGNGQLSAEESMTYFSEIQDSGQRLLTLLNDLLDISKLESGKMSYSMQENDIHPMIDTLLSELANLIRARALTIEIPKRSQQVIGHFDEGRIQQVLRNLLSNAIKFADVGSEISIAAEEVKGKLVVSVTNQGVGIPKDELQVVFDKFVQSSKTRTKAGGTGLGLAICKEIINAHQGKIWAVSDPGKKTRFIFEIPVIAAPIEAEEEVKAA